ncbi:monovalent cation:proton antiporter family protein [Pediococcus ethanolidurans]|uniref:cation:proton antiporter family protein n=1 Tax=Pediococcus ethanolidurans TaxID=319653 RepID=UPI001C1EE842|nr:cation:proton antiporter family protein [Pediococcus ethanolidurans]MBU7555468.1 monovalent cation:proton antiporter family protein [Pediococcus ethanolidurans]MBU7563822.1 monovalent cation:proton antiporter family protein [Pediococcus ethanolidurans]MCT4397440.1 potassium transporter [Pediococcus ethanolidurans]
MNQVSLLIMLFAALITPMLMARFKITFLPTAVVEIILGIVLGPSLLGLVHTTEILKQLSDIGVIILLFLSGMEIDFDLFKKPQDTPSPLAQKNAVQNSKWSPVILACLAYSTIIVISLVLAGLFKWANLFSDFWLAAILFATISLGIVIATLKENELLSKAFGQTVLLIAVLGEVVPMLGLTFYASVFGSSSKSLWLLLLIIVAAIFLLRRFKFFFNFFEQINKSTTQLDIRLAFFLIVAMVTVASSVGAENILGAFIAGIILKLLRPSESTKDKLDSIGYGFFIPIFFMMSGIGLNLRTLLSDPEALTLIPLFFLAYVIAKLAIYPILSLRFKSANAIAGTSLSTATITMVVAILQVAKNMHVINAHQSGAFLLAAILTCVFSPLIFSKAYRPEAEDLKKQTVHFIGANIFTVPVAQQLTQGWYDIQMYTDNEKNYRTYNSEIQIHLLENLNAEEMIKQGIFDTDILVVGHFRAQENYLLAKAAKAYGVERVIVRFEDRNILNKHEKELHDLGIEIYNTPEVNIAMLRGLIETPSTMLLLNDTTNTIFEVQVHNRKYTGLEIKNLPFIDKITISQIFRNHRLIRPVGTTQLELNDRLIFTGSKNDIEEIRHELGKMN